MDKNKAIIEYLSACPTISNDPLFFNFAEGEDNTKQIVTVATDRAIEKPYIDGCVLKKYTFTLIDYQSVIYQALTAQYVRENENVETMSNFQSIIDWIDEQNENRVFPNFGDSCIVESISALTSSPNLSGVDFSTSPNLAKYSVLIQVVYLDKSKAIWT